MFGRSWSDIQDVYLNHHRGVGMTTFMGDIDDQQACIRWLRSIASADSIPDRSTVDGRLLTQTARRLLGNSPLPEPALLTLADRHAASLSLSRGEALRALHEHGVRDGHKLNVGVGRAGAALVDEIDVPALVRGACGLRVADPTTATYVGYLEPGQRLELHLDLHGFGDLVFLLCLVHDSTAIKPSHTVLVTSTGQRRFGMRPGEGLLFDGARTPHGRTPVVVAERVVSIALGLTVIDRA